MEIKSVGVNKQRQTETENQTQALLSKKALDWLSKLDLTSDDVGKDPGNQTSHRQGQCCQQWNATVRGKRMKM